MGCTESRLCQPCSKRQKGGSHSGTHAFKRGTGRRVRECLVAERISSSAISAHPRDGEHGLHHERSRELVWPARVYCFHQHRVGGASCDHSGMAGRRCSVDCPRRIRYNWGWHSLRRRMHEHKEGNRPHGGYTAQRSHNDTLAAYLTHRLHLHPCDV